MIDFSDFKKDVSLKDYCTFHIGGKAKYLYIASLLPALNEVYLFCKIHNIKHKFIGLGANLLFDDKGFDGLIVVNRCAKIFRRGNLIFAESGAKVSEILSYSYKHNLGGLEPFAGIPATIGGAITNNLGAFGFEIGVFVKYVICLHNGNKRKLTKKECKFAYRDSIFKTGEYLILSACLSLYLTEKCEIKKKLTSALSQKISTQPLNIPSAGSVFKRGKIVPAKVIDELGLKGEKVGGAMVSNKHAGFIVNTDSATSKDVKKLIKIIQSKVRSAYGCDLELELEIVSPD